MELGAEAPEPDDDQKQKLDEKFNALVADIDVAAIEQAAATPEPEASEPAAPTPPVDPPPTNTTTATTPSIPAPPAELPAPVPPLPAAAMAAAPAAAPPRPVMPPRPTVIVEHEPRVISAPRRPDDKHFRMEKALDVGYWMSVGVGVVGQIASFGGMIASSLPGEMKYKALAYGAAALGAAFAEITMIGSGSAALKRRYHEGSWKWLAAIAWVVCLYATTLNIIHWAPIDAALAVMFGGGSLVGFTAHTVAEHLAARDYERDLVVYREKVAEIEAEQRAEAEKARREQERHHRLLEETAKAAAKAAAAAVPPAAPAVPAPETRPVPTKPAKPAAKAPAATSPAKRLTVKASKEDALRVGVEKKAATPATLKTALKDAGFELPSSSSTIENWCREIKSQLNNA